MLHGSCGAPNENAHYMVRGVCNQNFPKIICAETIIDKDEFSTYRSRDNRRHVKKEISIWIIVMFLHTIEIF